MHDTEADPRVSILIREEARRLKVYYPFLNLYLITESSPSFIFKTRYLGDSETITSRIPKL